MTYLKLPIIFCLLLLGRFQQAHAVEGSSDAYMTETQESKAEPVYEFIPPDYNRTAVFKSNRHFWIGSFNQSLGAIPGFPGMGFNLGAQGKFFGIDFRYISGKTLYRNISVSPDPSIASSFEFSSDVSEEVQRTRSPYDSWNFTLYDFGFDFSGHLLTEIFSFLSEKARIGFVYGHMNDLSNSIAFTPYLLTFETGLTCHFGPESRFSLDGTVGYDFGTLQADLHPGPFGVLPVSFMTYSLALNVWF